MLHDMSSLSPEYKRQRALQGKDKPGYLPHLDMGDVVVVKNAQHVEFTGKKWDQKLYRHHTG